jgi:hypothetical protein
MASTVGKTNPQPARKVLEPLSKGGGGLRHRDGLPRKGVTANDPEPELDEALERLLRKD